MPGRQRRQRGGRRAQLVRDVLRVQFRARAVEDLAVSGNGLRLRGRVLVLAGLVAQGDEGLRGLAGQQGGAASVVDVHGHGRGRRRRRAPVKSFVDVSLDGRHVDEVHALRRPVTGHRDVVRGGRDQRAEREVLAGERAHVGREVGQIPAAVGDEVILGGGQQGGDRAEVAQHSLALQLPDHVVNGRLLPGRAADVDPGKRVTGPDVREGLRRRQVQVLGAARLPVVAILVRVEARVIGVGLRVYVGEVRSRGEAALGGSRLDAHLHAAELLGQVVEADDVRLGEVVDVHAGDRLHRLDLEQLARLVGPEVEVVVAHLARVVVDVLVVGVVVGRVDLALGEPVEGGMGEVDHVVAGDREAHRLVPAGEDMDEDQRVRVLGADAALVDALDAARVRLLELVSRQRLPFEVGPALQAHHQDVHRADGRAPGDPDAGAERVQLADRLVGVAGHDQQDDRGQARRGVADVTDGDRSELQPAHTVSSRPPQTGLSLSIAVAFSQATSERGGLRTGRSRDDDHCPRGGGRVDTGNEVFVAGSYAGV